MRAFTQLDAIYLRSPLLDWLDRSELTRSHGIGLYGVVGVLLLREVFLVLQESTSISLPTHTDPAVCMY